jgi:hypothetical protein
MKTLAADPRYKILYPDLARFFFRRLEKKMKLPVKVIFIAYFHNFSEFPNVSLFKKILLEENILNRKIIYESEIKDVPLQ